MKKKHIIIALIALAAAAAIGLAVFFATHVSIGGEYFPKSAQVFDLTHMDLTADDYLSLREQYPDTQILWSVPFQGNHYPSTTQTITIGSLTEAEIPLLDFLPDLKEVDASQCTDYAALLALQKRRPDCRILYRVTLGDLEFDNFTQELTLETPDATELLEKLPLLPGLQKLTLTGTPLPPEDLLTLRDAFPSLELHYSVALCGEIYPWDAESIDLSGIPVTTGELADVLPLLPRLQQLTLQDTTLTDAELKELATQFPDIFFLCTLDFAGLPCSTDATTIDLSRREVTVEMVDAMLPLFPYLTKLDLSRCGIDDETMDALNQRHPSVNIVWMLRIGLVNVRTDDTVFYPSSVNELFMPNEEQLKKLRYCTEMVAVDVGHCYTTNCDWARYMPHLKYLIIADNPISDLSPLSGLKELIYLEVFRTNVTDYTPLLGCTALQDLNIGCTYGDPAPLAQMPWLHNVYWWYGSTQDATILENAQWLAAELPDTNVVANGKRSIDGGWRQIPNYYIFRNYIGGAFYNQEDIYIRWGDADGGKILRSEKYYGPYTAAEILSEIVRYRIDNGIPFPGIKNVDSEKAEILYQTILDSLP